MPYPAPDALSRGVSRLGREDRARAHGRGSMLLRPEAKGR
jgi:hypothetical protein